MPATIRWFSVNGLSIYSEVPLPAKLRTAQVDNHADIVIIIDPFLKNGIDPGEFYSQWSSSIATVCIPGSAVLRMMNGNRIIVSPFAGADEDRIQHIILYDGITAILAQRGMTDGDRSREVVTAGGRPY
jgi:hypothetical protein